MSDAIKIDRVKKPDITWFNGTFEVECEHFFYPALKDGLVWSNADEDCTKNNLKGCPFTI